jgi:large subunit ribosomal protein L21
MYAVIKTGGKQYRVQPGDVLVVEKLDGEPGANVAFGDVLMLGDDASVTVGAPTVAGASVAATLIETRKGDKVRIFKKIRRHGYRRTKGHRQLESVLQVTSISAGGKETKWDGVVNMTTKAVMDLRARGLDKSVAEQAPAPKAAKAPKAAPVEETVAADVTEAVAVAPEAAVEAPAKAAPKKAAAPKAEGEAKPAAKKPAAKKTDKGAE